MKILILDDHKVILNFVGGYLRTELNAEIIGVNSISDFSKDSYDVDIYIIDLTLEDGTGFDILDILSKNKNNKVIVYTSNIEPGVIRHLFKLKMVKGVVNKVSDESELVNAVNAVFGGEEYLCKKSNQIINSTKKKYYDLTEDEAELTPREREVLKLVWDNYTTEEIANKLFISPKTVENHRKNIKKKLGADSLISVLKKAFKKGYINTITD